MVVQKFIFQRIRELLPSHLSFVHDIATVLEISYDSAYRRMRGEKELTVDELIRSHETGPGLGLDPREPLAYLARPPALSRPVPRLRPMRTARPLPPQRSSTRCLTSAAFCRKPPRPAVAGIGSRGRGGVAYAAAVPINMLARGGEGAEHSRR